MTYAKMVDAYLADPCTSYWLKDAIKALAERDPLDALTDAEHLAKIMEQRWKDMFE